MPKTAVILFAHGAREPDWAQPFMKLRDRLRDTGIRTELAFLEIMSPSLEEAAAWIAADRIDAATIVPLFLAHGRHLTHELPALVAGIEARHRNIRFRVVPPLGDAPEFIDMVAAWIRRITGESAADRSAHE